jgi:hypothetical protein
MTTINDFDGEFRFLSNFFPAEVEFGGHLYPSTEHAFQAAKTLSEAERSEIRSAPTPGKAKRLGRRVTLRTDWEAVKVQIMQTLVEKKFADRELKEKLLATGDAELIEGNTWGDCWWGVDANTGKGENHLGKILMEVRSCMRASGYERTLYRIVLFGRPMKDEDGFETEEAAEARAKALKLNSWEYETEPYVEGEGEGR